MENAKELIQLVPDDDFTSHELVDRGLILSYGWNEELAGQLVECSRQEHISGENGTTPHDARRRFTDLETAMSWYESDQRYVYSLRDEEGKLAGIIWYDKRPRGDVGAANTFAIRIYEQIVGTGVGLTFMQAAQEDFERRVEDASVWLETDTTNVPARRLYDAFGYQTVSEENGRVTMVYRPE